MPDTRRPLPGWHRPAALVVAASSLPFLLRTVDWWRHNAIGLVAFSLMMPIVAAAACWLRWRATAHGLTASDIPGAPDSGLAAGSAGLRSGPRWAWLAASLAIAAAVGAIVLAQPLLGAVGLWLAALGALAFWRGSTVAARYALALAPLILMAPLTSGWAALIEARLQLASAATAELWLTVLGEPVLRDGVVLRTPTFLNRVDDTCSGIDTFTALLLYALLLGLILRIRQRAIAWIAVLTLPLALLLNGGRIAWISLLGERGGTELAMGPWHAATGWIAFGVGYALLLLMLLWSRRRRASSATGNKSMATAESGPSR